MRFSEAVSFTVSQGEDNRSVHIIVPTAVVEPASPPSPKVTQTARTPEARKATDPPKKERVKEKSAITTAKRYAVTLALSFEPAIDVADIRKNLTEFRDQTVYQITSTLFGIDVYFVRLGFFATSEEADAAKEKVRAKYPVAWVTLVTEDEHVAALRGKKYKPGQRDTSSKLAEVPKDIVPESAQEKFDTDYPYVINLESSLESDLTPPKALPEDLEKYRLYTTSFNKVGKTWHRLRLGFFATEREAQQVRQRVETLYPRAWVDLASREEIANSKRTALVLGDPKFLLRKPKGQVVAEPKGDADELMAQGRDALTRGDNVQAIRIFTRILALPKNEHTQDAQEYLALARERNGQSALAKVEYKLYLKLYPDGEGADRVRQRLANLSKPEKRVQLVELRKPKKVEEVHEWSMFGSLSQDYYRGASTIDMVSTSGSSVDQNRLSEIDQSNLVSYLDVTGRFRNTRYDNRAVFSGSQARDFLDSENDNRVRSAYIDILNKPRDYSARIGRQSGGTRGILSRFDGGLAGYSFRPRWRFNFVAGLPADDVAPESDRRFYGVSVDMGPFASRWNSTVYVIDQEVDGLTDRQAVGAELRYFEPKRSLFALLDYDIYFDEMNIAMVQGSWQPGRSTTFNLLLDYRKTPPLQTTNALLGQNVESIDQLTSANSDNTLKQMAEALTATSEVFTIGAVHPLNQRFQLGGDITVTSISDTEAVDGVLAVEGTGDVTTYNTQLIAKQLIFNNDVAVFNLSYSDSDTFSARSLSLIERFPFKRNWRVELNLNIYDRDDNIGSTLERITPTLRVDYRGRKNFTFDIEIARERTKVRGSADDEDMTRDFIRLGYRRDF
ncbi:MAG: SPOR domain-containing protein [Acidiferrobacterales bacterium]